jgi:hypothetical protein
MKKMNKLTVAALALAAIGLASTAASAQVTPGANDLVLSFQLAGVNTDLEVDLGSISALNLSPGAVTNLSSLFSLSDVSSTFGASWANNTLGTGVNWSVAGINGVNDGSSFYATSTAAAASVRTSNVGGLGTAHDTIALLTTGAAGQGSLNGAPNGGAGTASSALIGGVVTTVNPTGTPAGSLSESYTTLSGGNPGYTFVSNLEATGATTDDLFSFTPQSKVGTKFPLATDLGTFSLTATGFSFTAAGQAVPEPSAYALGICAAVLFLVLRRRQSVA